MLTKQWNFKINYQYYYTLKPLSVFSLAKGLQLILEMSSLYRLFTNLLADYWIICSMRTNTWFPRAMPSSWVVYNLLYNKTINNKTKKQLLDLVFDIWNNQGWQHYLDLDYSRYHKNSCNNYLKFTCKIRHGDDLQFHTSFVRVHVLVCTIRNVGGKKNNYIAYLRNPRGKHLPVTC